MDVSIYRKPRMVASNENSAASNEFVSSVGGKSTTGLRIEKDGGRERETRIKVGREREGERSFE